MRGQKQKFGQKHHLTFVEDYTFKTENGASVLRAPFAGIRLSADG